MSRHVHSFWAVADDLAILSQPDSSQAGWPMTPTPTHVLVPIVSRDAVEPITAARLLALADRLDMEARHLDANPGSVVRASEDVSLDEMRAIRSKTKVIHATHTLTLLRSLAAEFRQRAGEP